MLAIIFGSRSIPSFAACLYGSALYTPSPSGERCFVEDCCEGRSMASKGELYRSPTYSPAVLYGMLQPAAPESRVDGLTESSDGLRFALLSRRRRRKYLRSAQWPPCSQTVPDGPTHARSVLPGWLVWRSLAPALLVPHLCTWMRFHSGSLESFCPRMWGSDRSRRRPQQPRPTSEPIRR